MEGQHPQPLQDSGFASSAGSQGYNNGGGGPDEEPVNKSKPGKGKKVGQPPKGKRAGTAKAKAPRKAAAKKGGTKRKGKGGKKT